jgi:hypothetical protein
MITDWLARAELSLAEAPFAMPASVAWTNTTPERTVPAMSSR